MYPFWSLTPQTKEALDRYLVRDITRTQVFNFKLHMGHLEIKDVFPQSETQQKVMVSHKNICKAVYMFQSIQSLETLNKTVLIHDLIKLKCFYELQDLIKPVAEINCHRKYIANGVKREVVDEGGTFATVFLPDQIGKVPLVIVLSGGIHRGTIVEEKAALLAEKGLVGFFKGYILKYV